MTTAVVPVKALATAKSRLAPQLCPDARRALVGWMLDRVLDACAEAPSISDVLVVAGDAEGAALALRRGVCVLREPAPGLQAALRAADLVVGARAGTLVVPADLPACGAEDFEAVLAAGADASAKQAGVLTGPCVVVAPTTDGGTGALLRRPGDVISPAFGEGSTAAHAALARAAKVPFATCHRSGLAQDVDTVAQLRAVAAQLPELAAFLKARCGPLTEHPGDAARYPAPKDAAVRRLDECAESGMPQGTIKQFDVHTNTGIVVLDDLEELPIDAQTFARSGLLELRLGQRVRFEVTGSEQGGPQETRHVRNLTVISL